ncbi:hypothetical protein Hanom_Chr00s000003g01604521 [Helianthus anomalus]
MVLNLFLSIYRGSNFVLNNIFLNEFEVLKIYYPHLKTYGAVWFGLVREMFCN